MKIHPFDPVIYPRILWVATDATKDEVNKHFVNHDNEELETEDMAQYDARVYKCKFKENGYYGYLVAIYDDIDISTIAHEAYHVAYAYMEEMGADIEDEEPLAYLVGWAAKCISEALK